MHDKPGVDSVSAVVRQLWRRRKWLILTIFFISLSAVASLVLSLPDIYRATATLVVNASNSPSGYPSAPPDGSGRDIGLDTVTEQVLSRARLQELISRFDLYPDLRKKASAEAVIDRMRRDISLERKVDEQQSSNDGTFAFNLSYQGWEPKLVAEVTNALVASYVDQSNDIRSSQAKNTAGSLQAQLAVMKKKLDDREQKISTFRNNHIGELPEQQDTNLATLTQLNLQLNQNNENQIDLIRRRDDLLKKMADSGNANLAQLEEQLSGLRTHFTDKYPDVIRLKAQISALKQNDAGRVNQVTASPLEQQYRAMEAELNTYKTNESNLQTEIAKYRKRVDNIPLYAQQLMALTQGYGETKDVYASLFKRYENAQLAENSLAQNAAQFVVLDSAIPPQNPVGPNRLRLLFMGLILSFGLMAGTVFVAEQFDTSFHTINELRNFTALPILAGIPQIITHGDVWRRRVWLSFATFSIFLALVILIMAFHSFGNENQQLAWMLTKHG